MDKSQNKLYKTGKKWVITAFAATTIGASGYTLFNSNVAYADDGQTVTTNGNYVEMALNASKEAQSSSDIVSSISDKWQYFPGGDSLVGLKDQASNDAIDAAVASSKLAQPQINEQEQSIATSDALSYAADASSVASVATVSASSISNVASSMASSAQYKIGIYKSYAESVNAKTYDLANKFNEWDKDDVFNIPDFYTVDYLKKIREYQNSNVSSADSMLSEMNSLASSVNDNVIEKNNINIIDKEMESLFSYSYQISSFNIDLYYERTLSYASDAIQFKKDDDEIHQTADSLNNNDNKSFASAYSIALSAYDISKKIYIKMYSDYDSISSYIINTPYQNYASNRNYDSYKNSINSIKNRIDYTISTMKRATDSNGHSHFLINYALSNANSVISEEGSLASFIASYMPIDSVVDLENVNISMANSAYSVMDSMNKEFYSKYASEIYPTSTAPSSSTTTSSEAVATSATITHFPSSQNNSVYNPNNNFIYKIPTNSSNSSITNHSSQASSTNSSAEYYVPNSTDSSATSQSASSAFASSYATTSSSATSSSSNSITTPTNSDSNVYKKLYQKVQKNLTKEIAINKSKVAKFKKAYQKTKNKRDKAKQLKAYQDAQYKLKLAQKHYRSINK